MVKCDVIQVDDFFQAMILKLYYRRVSHIWINKLQQQKYQTSSAGIIRHKTA